VRISERLTHLEIELLRLDRKMTHENCQKLFNGWIKCSEPRSDLTGRDSSYHTPISEAFSFRVRPCAARQGGPTQHPGETHLSRQAFTR